MNAGPAQMQVNDYDRMSGRKTALELSVKLALECGEVDPEEIITSAGKFADFMIDNKREDK